MDNALYHTVQINKVPSIHARKAEMIAWLEENNLQYSEAMRKYELQEIKEANKSMEKVYKVDTIMKSEGHIILRSPPYMCELNPIELAWAQIKRKVRERNTGTLTFTELLRLTKEAIDGTTVNDWNKFCDHIEKLERQYYDQDFLLETAMDNLNINIEDTFSEDNEAVSEDSV
ncbi:uncharacterized protein LOC128896596 [Hylaeus anthracinus]|uniref:uncharacterized protein LOC128896596 n=1 Tax=Hylaeus anthracinus TaxID=313031 RepID=UPI0023B9005D|nr:uncharacterized protein LOC128896596 [Hylaeus anthracinus]